MNGDNPGIFQQFAQTEWWPFIPACGVAAGVALVIAFACVAVLAAKRQAPVSWAAVSGLFATAVLGSSIFGCSVAMHQWEEQNRQQYGLYVAEVATWATNRLEAPLAEQDAALLLSGATLPYSVDGQTVEVRIERDLMANTLTLIVNQP